MDEAKMTVLAHSTMPFGDDGRVLGFLHGYIGQRKRTVITQDLEYHAMCVMALETGGLFDIHPGKYPVGVDGWPDEWASAKGLEYHVLPGKAPA